MILFFLVEFFNFLLILFEKKQANEYAASFPEGNIIPYNKSITYI